MVILAWTIFNQGRNDIQKPKCNSLLGATKKISTLIAVPYGEANQSILNTFSVYSVCQGNFVCNLMIPVDLGERTRNTPHILQRQNFQF